MKNINPSSLTKFHGIALEYPDTFIFEFEVVCRTYDYRSDAKKLNIFPFTLKDATLRWFMSLKGNNIETWEQMKDTFKERYEDYYKSKDTRDEIFRMTQEENESLEDFEERFQLSYKISHSCTLDDDSLKLVILQGVREEYMDTLNLLFHGYISHLTCEEIKKIFKNYSRSSSKKGKSIRNFIPPISRSDGDNA